MALHARYVEAIIAAVVAQYCGIMDKSSVTLSPRDIGGEEKGEVARISATRFLLGPS